MQVTWYALMTKWKCCDLSYAYCRICALISDFRAVPKVIKSLENKELIDKAESDNTDLYRNY